MTFSILALLSLFTLLALSSAIYFLAERTKVPYTVLLVAVGAFVLVPLSQFPAFSFITEFTFTPELLFYVFLPILIFESAYNIQVRRLMENIWAISALSVVSLLISAGAIGGALYVLLPLVGIEVPLILCLLFGALISATDPVAVLALFKELGAPRRLTLLFEGESIFNDGTAVALFLVILAIAVNGWHGTASVLEGLSTFVTMMVAGVLVGLALGYLFVWAIDRARRSEYVQISLMIVLAHFTFIISDYMSQHLSLFGHHLHVSAIISTTIASMVMGNYGRSKILPHAREFVEQFWTESALLANSLIFLLIGLIFTTLPIHVSDLAIPIVIAVLVVASARALSIYPVVWVLNRVTREADIPRSWQHLLAWGSLRGALAITMVLLIPEDLALAGWNLAYTPREFIMGLTIGCIFTTLFLKATTIKPLAHKLHTDDLTETEQLQLGEATALVHAHALERLTKFREKGYVDVSIIDKLSAEHTARLDTAIATCGAHLEDKAEVGERVLRLYALGVEKNRLADLYEYGEVSESVYRKIHAKLSLQYERIEHGSMEDDPAPSAATHALLRLWDSFMPNHEHPVAEHYTYYRTLVVLSRAALREVRALNAERSVRLFGADAIKHITSIYEQFVEGATAKLRSLEEDEPSICKTLSERFVRRSILEVESRTLHELYEREMITPKVYLSIKAIIDKDADTLAADDEK